MYDKCRRYAVDWNIILPNTDIDSLAPNESWPLQRCDKGWEYNKTDVQSSIVIDVRKMEEIFYFSFLSFYFHPKAQIRPFHIWVFELPLEIGAMDNVGFILSCDMHLVARLVKMNLNHF